MSMIEQLLKLDRKVRRLYEEFGLDYDDEVAPLKRVASAKQPGAANGSRRWTNDQRDQLVQLVTQGISSQEIARVMERSDSAIHTQVWQLRKDGQLPKLNEERT